MLIALTVFPRGEQKYTAHTDTNHNTNSSRYQLVVGGSNNKTIGVYLFDSILLKKSEIAHDLFSPADFQAITLSSFLHQFIPYMLL